MLFVGIVIVFSGGLGGVARYLAQSDDKKVDFAWRVLATYTLLGVVAAAVVPLFLHVVAVGSEGLVSKLLLSSTPTEEVGALILILIGFCLLAGYYARNFIESVADVAIQRANKATEESGQAVAAANEALLEAQGAAETASEVQSDAIESAARDSRPVQDLEDRELRVLRAMRDSGYKRPWPSTLAEIAGFDEAQVKQLLRELEHKGLVQERQPSEDGNERWRVRSWGHAALRQDAETR